MKLSEFKNFWEHAHGSPFEGKMKKATQVISGINESCGDEIILYLKLDSKKRITDVSFTHSGCTLSYIGSSVLLEKILGKQFKDAQKLREADFLNFFDTEISHGRLRCILLALESMKGV